MGARQSKRSVDITTGKEVAVEGGEVAAGAGGEGKLERIEDLDTLKPQLNGDAHQEEQISEKEKKMQEQDERQENEKDNCNEKEIVLTPVTVNGSGEGEVKEEEKNVEQEVKEKKPKKVKKKWSFRSISFSKKDKQKPAKKEETNGECEKVPEEGADAAPVVAEVADAKVESSAEKDVSEKEPETPVTEPLTNGSSAPESPKDEIKQNGESTSVTETISPVEPIIEAKEVEVPKSEPVAESPKEEEAVEVKSEVEALPINGLSIEEPALEEVKAPIVDQVIAPAEEKSDAVGDSEVCSEKELPEVGSVEVPPPPLPSCPPPSSLTIFAESTMAPLVDTQNVDTSLPSLTPAVTAQSDSIVQNVSNESETHSSQLESVTPSDAPLLVENKNDTDLTVSPVGNENIDVAISPVVENVAVVSADNLVAPDSSAIIEPLDSVVTSQENDKEDTSSSVVEPEPVVELAKSENSPLSEALKSVPKDSVETPSDNVESEISQSSQVKDSVQPTEIAPTDNSCVLNSQSEETAPSIDNVNVISNEPNLPSPVDEVNTINDSPILQRASSDLDVSETMPPSDSFPPPPPPESCSESITETSASESLPPPMSEFSVPDAILNSPTSETAELPGKDQVIANGENVPETNQVEENGVHHHDGEVNGFSAEEFPTTDVNKVPGLAEQPSVEIPQVKTVSDVADVPAPTESVITESVPSGDAANE